LTPLIPYLPIAAPLGFVPLPLPLLAALLAITAAYIFASEAVKPAFYRSMPGAPPPSGGGTAGRRV
jgi:hypothetical protein